MDLARILVPKYSDGFIYTGLTRLIQKNSLGIQTTYVTYVGSRGGVDPESQEKHKNFFDSVISKDKESIQEIQINLGNNYRVHFTRYYEKAHDQIQLHSGEGLASESILGFFEDLKSEFHAFNTKNNSWGLIPEEVENFYRTRENRLVKFENFQKKIIADNLKFREELQNEHSEQRNKIKKEHERKLEEIRRREFELEQKQKAFDDRESKLVRREIRKEIKKQIEEKKKEFRLSQGTSKLRRPILYTCISSLLLFGFLIVAMLYLEYFSGKNGTTNQTEFLYFIVKQSILSVAFGSILVYFLRWSSRWSQQHADEEFRFQRYELDIDRASWIVEMGLEWKKETQQEIPSVLLEKLCSSLFENPYASIDKNPELEDDLASLIMGSATSVKVSLPTGGEIVLDRKGLRRALKQAKN